MSRLGMKFRDFYKEPNLYQNCIDLIKTTFSKAANGKPIDGNEITKLIDRLIEELLYCRNELISSTSSSTPNNYLYGHSVNVCILSIEVGKGLGYDRTMLNELGVAALLHDIGMKLSNSKYDEIKKHTIYGAEILRKVNDIPESSIYVAAQHHERLDGSGYPEGLKDDQISECAKIVGLVDTYEALTHPRPYQERLSSHIGLCEIIDGKGIFEPRCIEALLNQITLYPIGTWVKLSTGEMGKVVGINEGFPLRPVVNVVFNSEACKLDEPKRVNLAESISLSIMGLLSDEMLNKLSLRPPIYRGEAI